MKFSNETAKTCALRAKMKATERKLHLLDAITGSLISGLLIVTAIVLSMLTH